MPRRPRHRRLASIAFAVALALALLAAIGVTLAAPALAERAVARALAERGLAEARFEVAHVGLAELRLVHVVLGPDLEADAITLSYDPLELVTAGRARTLALTGARWTLPRDERALAESSLGRLLELGEDATHHDRSASAPPLDRIELDGARVIAPGLGALELDADVSLAREDGALVLRSDETGLTLSARARTDHAADRTELELELRADGGTTLRGTVEIDRADRTSAPGALRFDVRGRVPAALATRLSPALYVTGEPRVRASGALRRDGDRWAITELSADAKLPHVFVPEAELDLVAVSAALRGEGTLEGSIGTPSLVLALDDRSRLRAARVATPSVRLERIEIPAALRLDAGAHGARVSFADPSVPLRAHLGAFVVGEGDAELRLEEGAAPIALSPRAPDRAVLLDVDPHGVARIALSLDAPRARARGLLRASSVHARGPIELELGPEAHGARPRLSIALRVDAPRAVQPDGEIALRGARVDLPLRWDEHRTVVADGRVRARELRFRDVSLGPSAGTLRLSPDRLVIRASGAATATARYALALSVALDEGRSTLDVDVPVSTIARADAASRLLASLTDMTITGRAGGSLHVDLARPGEGDARFVLEGASIEQRASGVRAKGVRGTIALASLDPLSSAGLDALAWQEIALGSAATVREGSARLRFDRGGGVRIEDARAALGGGTISAAPFAFDVDDESPEATLRLALEGVSVGRVLELLSQGRARGNGHLDGRVELRVRMGERPRVVLGGGRLAARGPGHFRIDELPARATIETDLESVRGGEWIERRVVAALADFRYSDLALDLVPEGGTTHLRAHVTGRGNQTPQELDLTLDVRGLQPVLDQALRLMP